MGISIGGVSTYGALSGLQSAESDRSSLVKALSSGTSLSPSSDAANVSIDQGIRSQTAGLQQASANAQTGVSALQTADGALGQVGDLLQNLRSLAVQAGNGALDSSALSALGNQASQYVSQIDQIASSTTFAGSTLLDGSSSNVQFQTGADATSANQQTASLPNATSSALGLASLASAIQGGNVGGALSAIDNALSSVGSSRSNIGAGINSLSDTATNLGESITNLTGADSRISDADMAQSVMRRATDDIKSQFSVGLLAQTNALNKQSSLALLKTL